MDFIFVVFVGVVPCCSHFCWTTVDIPNEVTFFSQQERELPGLPGMRVKRVIGGLKLEKASEYIKISGNDQNIRFPNEIWMNISKYSGNSSKLPH